MTAETDNVDILNELLNPPGFFSRKFLPMSSENVEILNRGELLARSPGLDNGDKL